MFSLLRPSRERAAAELARGGESGNYRRALRELRRLVRRSPDDHELHAVLGCTLLASDRAAEARGHLERATELMPESGVYWTHLGRCALAQGEAQTALTGFENARRLSPGDPQPWLSLSLALDEADRLDDAIAEVERLLARHPDCAEAHHWLGLQYERCEEPVRALPHFERAVELDPEGSLARMALIHHLCDAGCYDDVVPHLEFLARQGLAITVRADERCIEIRVDGELAYIGETRGKDVPDLGF